MPVRTAASAGTGSTPIGTPIASRPSLSAVKARFCFVSYACFLTSSVSIIAKETDKTRLNALSVSGTV